ncbi:MAG TPA: hypothetical protein VGD81_02070 [Opitutaceae bacterium]
MLFPCFRVGAGLAAFALLSLLISPAFTFAQLPVPAGVAPGWRVEPLGHVFQSGQPVELRYAVDAELINWRITDFWHREVERGSTPASGGVAVIRPATTAVGYYLLQVVPVKGGAPLRDHYTSFAIVRPHESPDPANSPFGVMTHFAQGMNPKMLPIFKQIGIQSIRDEHYWEQVEKTRGAYQFPPKSDAYMQACEQAGISPLVAMTFGNPLYDHKAGPSTPAGFEGYANYGKAILDHYGSEVRWLEIWNEYNGTWCPPEARKDRPKFYTEMLKTAYERIKAVRPDVQVLGGAAVLIPLPYFEGIFKRDGLKYMDGVVIHPYRGKPEGVDREVAELKALMRKYNDGREKPIWVTETGRHTTEEYEWEKGRKMFEKGRAEGARYLARQYTLLLKENVAKIYWYLASDHANFVSMGLLRHHQKEASGMGEYAVAPSFVAYANLIHQLDGARFVRREARRDYSRAQVNLFRRDGDEIRVCWATQPARIRLATEAPLTVANLMGTESVVQPVDGEVVLDLTEDALYVRGPVAAVNEIDTGVRVLAASTDDYSKTQGENNWFYGYATDNNPFTELTQIETIWGYNWGGLTKNLVISDKSMHPDQKDGKALRPVLRWKSPVDGPLTVEGSFIANTVGKGDGVIAGIRVDGREVYAQPVGGAGAKRLTVKTPIEVKKGSVVDISISAGASIDYDATAYDLVILQENRVTSTAGAPRGAAAGPRPPVAGNEAGGR